VEVALLDPAALERDRALERGAVLAALVAP